MSRIVFRYTCHRQFLYLLYVFGSSIAVHSCRQVAGLEESVMLMTSQCRFQWGRKANVCAVEAFLLSWAATAVTSSPSSSRLPPRMQHCVCQHLMCKHFTFICCVTEISIRRYHASGVMETVYRLGFQPQNNCWFPGKIISGIIIITFFPVNLN